MQINHQISLIVNSCILTLPCLTLAFADTKIAIPILRRNELVSRTE